MSSTELKNRFNESFKRMSDSKDVANMKLFGTAFSMMFSNVAESYPELAVMILDFLEAIEYNNFVTKAEAEEIASHFINDDVVVSGTTTNSQGAHWTMDALKSFLTQRGLPLEEKPYYNWPALWVAVNMMYSDYADAYASIFGKKDNDTIAVAAYTFAVKKLKDLDRPKFIREYFHLDG